MLLLNISSYELKLSEQFFSWKSSGTVFYEICAVAIFVRWFYLHHVKGISSAAIGIMILKSQILPYTSKWISLRGFLLQIKFYFMKGETQLQLLSFICFKKWISISKKVIYIVYAWKIHRKTLSISNFVLKCFYLSHDERMLQMREKPK